MVIPKKLDAQLGRLKRTKGITKAQMMRGAAAWAVNNPRQALREYHRWAIDNLYNDTTK